MSKPELFDDKPELLGAQADAIASADDTARDKTLLFSEAKAERDDAPSGKKKMGSRLAGCAPERQEIGMRSCPGSVSYSTSLH